MAATSYAVLRRKLMQRLGYWGGNIASGTAGTLSAVTNTTTVADNVNRTEPDGEYDGAFMVVNPGLATVAWAKIATYLQSGGQFTLQNALPGGVGVGATYEIFKVARPEQMLQAINWALTMAYPQRHIAVDFEVNEDPTTVIYDYKYLAINATLADPTTTLTVAAVSDPVAPIYLFQAGTYQVTYAWIGEVGMTKETTGVASVTLTAGQGIDISSITAPDGAIGIQYYVSLEAGSTTRASIPQNALYLATTAPVNSVAGRVLNGSVPEVIITGPPGQDGDLPGAANTTSADMQDLQQVHRRLASVSGGPEIFTDLGANNWRPIGGTRIQLQYSPANGYRLRFIGTAPLLELVNETDTTTEPVEMVLNGAEYFLWHLLSKTSNIQAVNWEKLAAMAQKDYTMLKDKYAMDQASTYMHRPKISVMV